MIRRMVLLCILALFSAPVFHAVVIQSRPSVAALGFAQITDTHGQEYYENVKSIVDFSLPEVLKDFPELQGLEPAKNQDALLFILGRAGLRVQALSRDLPNTTSREEIDLEEIRRGGKVKAKFHQEFNYLILPRGDKNKIILDEYRTDSHGRRAGLEGVKGGYPVTEGFTSMWVHFYPSNKLDSNFRYLGQQVLDGDPTYVVAFAQRPGWADVTGQFTTGEKTVLIMYQGIAWIAADDFRILRLRTDLLAPRPEVELERQTTEIRFRAVQFPQVLSRFWLPSDVTVTTVCHGQIFRNRHHYSDYRLFTAETKIKPIPP